MDEHPWRAVPTGDYEGHMRHPGVQQWQLLGEHFRQALERWRPRRLLVLGAATGNGFEHIDPDATAEVVALDVNTDYLAVLEARHRGRLPGLEILVGDFPGRCPEALDGRRFDMIYGSLFWEYIDPAGGLERAAGLAAEDAVLVALLQRPSGQGQRTATPFTALERIIPIMTLHEPAAFVAAARSAGFREEAAGEERLESAAGKPFWACALRRSGAG